MALTDSLVSYWKLDESSGNAADAHGSNTLVNQNTTTFVAAKINNGADVEAGSSQGFQVTDAAQTGLDITGDISISFWVKHETLPPADGSAPQYYIDKRKVSGASGEYTFAYGGIVITANRNLGIELRDSSNNISRLYTTNGYNLSTTVFQHVVFSVTVATPAVAIYVDGVSQAISSDSASATSIGNTNGPFTVGYAISPGTVPFDGIIDEVGIWSRTLSSAEVTTLYNGGAGLAYPFTAATSIKTINGLAKASVKTVNGLAIASIKSINGLT